MADDRSRCAAVSVRRGEPLHATASRVRRWLVVEHPAAWGRDALLESGLDPVLARNLHAHARRHGVRVLLARRPGWAPGQVATRRVHLAVTGPGDGWIEHLDLDDDALGRLDLAVLRAEAPPGIGAPGPGPLVLVCTNGRHDPCCADLGRPVVRALAAAGVPHVWECSHVGGDRFAANVVALPWGVYLGRVPPERAASIVTRLAAGELDLDHFRGRSCFPTLVQATELAARQELDETRLGALALDTVDQRGDDEAVVRWRRGDDVVEVHVARRRGDRALLTCGDGTGRPWIYERLGLTRR